MEKFRKGLVICKGMCYDIQVKDMCRRPLSGAGTAKQFRKEGGNPMPNIKSAKKRVRVIRAKTLQNQMFRSQMRTVIKKYDAALAAGDKEQACAAYKLAVKKIDQAVAHGILHKNNAARKKSRFTVKLNKMA